MICHNCCTWKQTDVHENQRRMTLNKAKSIRQQDKDIAVIDDIDPNAVIDDIEDDSGYLDLGIIPHTRIIPVVDGQPDNDTSTSQHSSSEMSGSGSEHTVQYDSDDEVINHSFFKTRR